MFDTQNFFRGFSRRCAVAALVISATLPLVHISAAFADDDGDASEPPRLSNAKWKEECGACHLAYPPSFLPAESWRAIMSRLDRHFGSNASLDAATAREIRAFLEKNADAKKHKVLRKPLLRITQTRWFKSEHEEVAARAWKNAKVKSPANCGACHGGAELGDFNEDDVQIPE